MLKRTVLTATIFLLIVTITLGVIWWSRGYRINFGQKSLTPTGILSASSSPDKASIFIDGKLTSATNASLTLPPNWYTVKIDKEGYQAWEKKIRVQGEVVTQIDALLLPSNPSLRALTTSGISIPTLSPSGVKVAYIVPQDESIPTENTKRVGVWILELRTSPLGGKIEPKHIFTPSSSYDFSTAKLFWSPDEKELLITFSQIAGKKETVTTALNLHTEEENTIPQDVTLSYHLLLTQWAEVQGENEKSAVETNIPKLSDTLLAATNHVRFSPDETKMLYTATSSATLPPVITPPLIGSNSTSETRSLQKESYYVYDIKEDKNYFLGEKKSLLGENGPIWYSDSKHVVLVEKDTISLVDFDGTNKKSVYSGPFDSNLVYTWPGGGRLVILTNINRPQTLPNLYEIDLR